MSIIERDDADRHYNRILEQIQLGQHSFNVIVGLNGSGKSTFLKCIVKGLNELQKTYIVFPTTLIFKDIQPNKHLDYDEADVWYIDAYFDFIKQESKDVDCVIIDDYGDGVSLSVLKELTRKLISYSRDKTFIMATHNPTAIILEKDEDHLNEVIQKDRHYFSINDPKPYLKLLNS